MPTPAPAATPGTPPPAGPPHTSRRRPPATAEAAGLVLLLTVLLSLVLVAFAVPAAESAPRDVPIGLAGPAAATGQVEQALDRAAPGAFEATRYPDERALRQAIADREVYGGFALRGEGPLVLIATGGSPAVAQALGTAGAAIARGTGAAVQTEDLAPLPDGDPRGAGLAAAALPITLGGLLPAVLLLLRFPQRPWLRIVAAASFALLAGAALAAVLQYWVGAVGADAWRVGLGLALGLGAIAAILLGLGSLLGRAGLGLGAATILLLGMPLSGLATAPEFLPSGWGTLGQLLPPGANATLLRSTAYFDGAGATQPVVVLASWVAAGLLLTALAARRRPVAARAAGTDGRDEPAQPVVTRTAR